jgi:hypothetical protein
MADLMEMQLGYSRCAAKDRADESSAKEHRTEASRLVVSARAALRLGLFPLRDEGTRPLVHGPRFHLLRCQHVQPLLGPHAQLMMMMV